MNRLIVENIFFVDEISDKRSQTDLDELGDDRIQVKYANTGDQNQVCKQVVQDNNEDVFGENKGMPDIIAFKSPMNLEKIHHNGSDGE